MGRASLSIYEVCLGLTAVALAIGASLLLLEWNAYDEIGVRAVFLILGSRRAPAQQLRVLADVSVLVRQPGFLEGLLAATDESAMYEALRSASTRKA